MTVFRRFDSKDRLVQTVLLRVVAHATARIHAAFLREAGLTEALVVSVQAFRDHPLFVKVRWTEPDAFLRTLTTDGESVAALIRSSVTGWLGRSGGGPLSDKDAEVVAEMVTRLGISLILSPGGPIPIDDDELMRAYMGPYLVPGIVRLAAS